MSQKKTRIGLLALGGKQWLGGLIYLHNIIRTIALLPQEEQPELFLFLSQDSEKKFFNEPGLDAPKRVLFSHDKTTPAKEFPKRFLKAALRGALPLSLERAFQRHHIDVLFPCLFPLYENFPIRWGAWAGDFQHKRLPQFFSEIELQKRDQRYIDMIARAKNMVVSSQDSYNDLMRWFPMKEEHVFIYRYSTISEDKWYMPNPKETADTYNLPQKYIMYPAQLWIHKNHFNLLKALKILRKKNIVVDLVLTGKDADFRFPEHPDTLKKYIRENDLTSQVHYLGILPREEQVQLIRRSAAIIQPSYFEGWGLNVEDSRTLGKKIYLSDIPIHREQNHPDAHYFDPDKPEEMVALLKRDWDALEPGPDLKREKDARSAMTTRAIADAHNFLNIMRQIKN